MYEMVILLHLKETEDFFRPPWPDDTHERASQSFSFLKVEGVLVAGQS